MKKPAFSAKPALFIAIVTLTMSCREGSGEQANAPEGQQDTTQAIQAPVVTPTDSLATELDATSEEIEQETKALQSALDSL